MIRPRRHFPWKIVRHFVARQVLALVITLVAAAFSLR
jgi:hypothetical protein